MIRKAQKGYKNALYLILEIRNFVLYIKMDKKCYLCTVVRTQITQIFLKL